LRQVLHRKVTAARQAARRNKWIGGRWYNRMSGDDPDYVPLSGTHLRQALLFAEMAVPDIVVRSGQYLLRLDIAQQAEEALVE